MTGAALLLTALTTVSCSQQEDIVSVAQPADGRITFTTGIATTAGATRAVADGDPIALKGAGRQLWLVPVVQSTSEREQQLTRGTQLNSTDKLSSFGVSAFKHEAGDGDLSDNLPDYFYNLQATEVQNDEGEGTGVYQIAQPYYWPTGTERLTFNAYYPYGNDNVKLTDLNSTEANKNLGPQRFTVKVAASAKEQVDFMTATTGETPDASMHQSAKPGVNLTFQHHMTAVRFVLGSQFLGGYIKSIMISGVYGKGTYVIGSGWTLDADDKTTVNISYMTEDRLDKHVDGTNGQDISADGEAFLLIPQEFADDDAAVIKVLFHDGYDDYLVEASLAGQAAWLEGTTVTYAISSDYLTTLKISEIDFPVPTYNGAAVSAPKTGWTAGVGGAEGDCVGLYVVKADGTTLAHANVKCEYVGGTSKWKWQIHHPVDAESGETTPVFKLPGYTYYFYYPYKEGTPSGYPVAGLGAGVAATTFFSSVISSYTTVADQGDLTKFNAADLQVAKAQDAAYSSTITATMERQVGLARLQLSAPADVYARAVYVNNELNTTKSAVKGMASRAAVNKFETNTPVGASGVYYFYTKANTGTTLNSIQSDVNAWKQGHEYNIAAGAVSEIWTAESRRHDWPYVSAIWEYTKTGSNTASTIHTFTIPTDGTYTMECWGASGGNGYLHEEALYEYGRGAYTTGKINLTTTTNNGSLFVYVGGKGTNLTKADITNAKDKVAGGFNGGGYSLLSKDKDDHAGSGGGATDIRLTNNATAWTSRIMVAAGGGGGHEKQNSQNLQTSGLHGGAPNVSGKLSTYTQDWDVTVNQTSGNGFGQGKNGELHTHSQAGAGGGYQGGISFYESSTDYAGSASGGSSFISGATTAGCSTVTGYAFDNATAVFKKGTDTSCPSQTIDGSPAALGQVNGYARITLIRE